MKTSECEHPLRALELQRGNAIKCVECGSLFTSKPRGFAMQAVEGELHIVWRGGHGAFVAVLHGLLLRVEQSPTDAWVWRVEKSGAASTGDEARRAAERNAQAFLQRRGANDLGGNS